MEIIQLYKSDDGSEVCVISDGSIIYFTDKSDVAVDSPSVGTIVRPSQVNEAYLEIPKELLQEVARRSEIAVEPDPDEESEDSEDDPQSETPPPDWRPFARELFLERFKSWNQGKNLRIIVPLNIRLFCEDGDLDEEITWASSDGSNDLGDILRANPLFIQGVAELKRVAEQLSADYKDFVDAQIDLGHDLTVADVDEFIYQTAAEQESVAAE